MSIVKPNRKHSYRFYVNLLLSEMVLVLCLYSVMAQTRSDAAISPSPACAPNDSCVLPPQDTTRTAAVYDLDNEAKYWGAYCEGRPEWNITPVDSPAGDGKALRFEIVGGDNGYSNVHFYRNLAFDSTACTFTLALRFYFSPTTCNNDSIDASIQALEFSLSKWWRFKRYEVALQWQNVGAGAPQWRYWDPHRSSKPVDERWAPFNPPIAQCLIAQRWHTLVIKGEIHNDLVYYREFRIDNDTHQLDLKIPPFVEYERNNLAVAVQLDGNSKMSPYAVLIDSVSFVRERNGCEKYAKTSPCLPPPGSSIDAMEQAQGWRVLRGSHADSASLREVPGYRGQALELKYSLQNTTQEAWAQIRRDFDPPLDLTQRDHIRLYYCGTQQNTLEIGLVDGRGEIYFASPWESVTHVPWFTYATWDLQDFRSAGKPQPDLSQVHAIFISVVKKSERDLGGAGALRIDELESLQLATRPVPASFESITVDSAQVRAAAAWIAAQQTNSGLLKSWREEATDYAWLYDQALGLIVLTKADLTKAKILANKLVLLQNAEGSWYEGYRFEHGSPANTKEAVGAIAWTVYALMCYYSQSSDMNALIAAQKGANWLASKQRENGSMPDVRWNGVVSGESTEPNLDAWWAFYAAGTKAPAERLKTFLLEQVWDEGLGRFKSSPNSFGIYLDNQTWGAAFLRAVGEEQKAHRALSYAPATLVTHSQAQTSLCGFDGAGPFGVWNEGTLQYLSQGGENSQYYWDQMAAQQASDGSLPGASLPPGHENFRASIVWLTSWHGLAPAAWFYFAGTGGPFGDYCITAVNAQVPEEFSFELSQNYPNPFNPETAINFRLPVVEEVELAIFNSVGQLVRKFVLGEKKAGSHYVKWDGKDDSGKRVASGVYVYVIKAGTYTSQRKLLLLK